MSLNDPPSPLERFEALERLPELRSKAAQRRRRRAAALAGAVMMVVAAGVVPASLLAFRGGSPETQVHVGSPGPTTPSTQTPSPTTAPTTSPSPSVPPSTSPPTTSPQTTAPPAGAASGPAGGPVPPGFGAASVTFVSDSEGFVLGTAPCAKAPCTSVLRTTDGGASWVGIPAPVAPLAPPGAGTQGAVSELRFADPLDGFAFGTGLWTTHDGGAHWSQPASVAGISPYVVSELVATPSGVYALVQGVDPVHGGGDGHYRLVRGSASGDSFSVVHDFGANVNVDQLVAGGGVVYALASQVGSTSLSLVRAEGSAVTTTPVALSGLQSSTGGAYLAASSASDLLLEVGSGVSDGAMGSRQLYGSTDSGRSWAQMSEPGMGAGYDDFGIADAGGGHAVIATGSGVGSGLLATTNFAQSWSLVLSIPGQSLAGFGDLGFEDTTHGVVIFAPDGPLGAGTAGSVPAGSGVLYRTSDGGASWAAVAF